MAWDAPFGIVLRRHRDLQGREWHIWVRRGLMLVPVAVVALALANVFGQRSSTSVTGAAAASLEVAAPNQLRGGLLTQLSIMVVAHRSLRHARLVLHRGWLDGMTINTVEPSPSSETSRGDGSLQLDLGPLAAGQSFTQYVSMQVNPTTVGRRNADIDLLDGERTIATAHRTLTVLP